MPDTDDRRAHIEAEIEHDVTMSWWVECLERGVVCGVPWPETVIYLALEADYQRFCEQQHRHPLGKTRFRRLVKTWLFGRDQRDWPSDRHRITVANVNMSTGIRMLAVTTKDMGPVETGFSLPPREISARAFYAATGYRPSLRLLPPATPAPGSAAAPVDDGLPF